METNIDGDEATETRIRVQIPSPLLFRIERLIARPELGFQSLEHFLSAAIFSFVAYKERQVSRLRADAEGG